MKAIFIILWFLLSLTLCFSQKLATEDLTYDPEWHEGSILLTDETEIVGLVNYNDRKGVISFENGSYSRTYTARNVLGFEFHDSRTGKHRVFYSLEHDDSRASNNGPFVFEVLRDLKSFAVLYKADPLDVENVQLTNNSGMSATGYQAPTYSTYTKITQNETIYLLSEEHQIVPIIEMTFKQTQGRLIDRSKTKSKGLN